MTNKQKNLEELAMLTSQWIVQKIHVIFIFLENVIVLEKKKN